MSTLTILEVIIVFQCLSVFNSGPEKKPLTVPWDYRAGSLIAFRRKRLLKARKELFSKSSFIESSDVMASYEIFDNSICQFQVLATRSKFLSPFTEQKSLVDVADSEQGEGVKQTSALDWSRKIMILDVL